MRRRFLALAILGGLAGISVTVVAADLHDIDAVPQLDTAGRDGYRDFLAAGGHRAFAIAPGGAWTWLADGVSADAVADETVQTCESNIGRPCALYALDDKVVFNSRQWTGLLGPYLDRRGAARAPTGSRRGERFYDLTFTSPAGAPMKLSDLRGKVVVLHFWGSWCPPCRRELPELQRIQHVLGDSGNIRIVLLQAREGIADARGWARQQQLKLPLYDSGAAGGESETLPLADGTRLPDRSVARVFPTTYVLDRHGVVVFSHSGPITRWQEYLPLLRDVAANSGK